MREAPVRELGKRFPAPQAQALLQQPGRLGRAAFRQGPLARLDLLLEADQIERPRFDAQQVAAAAPDQHLALAYRGEGLAQPREVHVQAVLAPGCPLTPHVGQQAAARDNLVRVQHKNRQHRALLGPPRTSCSPSLQTSSGPRSRNSTHPPRPVRR